MSEKKYPQYKSPPEPPPKPKPRMESKTEQSPEPRTTPQGGRMNPGHSTPLFTAEEQLVIISAKMDTLLEQQQVIIHKLDVIERKVDLVLQKAPHPLVL